MAAAAPRTRSRTSTRSSHRRAPSPSRSRALSVARGRTAAELDPCLGPSGKGLMGSALTGVTANFVFFDRGTFWVLLLTYLYIPKSDRAYLFPQSVRIHYFCSGPISVDPNQSRHTMKAASEEGSMFSWAIFRGRASHSFVFAGVIVTVVVTGILVITR